MTASIKSVNSAGTGARVKDNKLLYSNFKPIWLLLHYAILILGIYLVGASITLHKQVTVNRLLYRLDLILICSNYGLSLLYFLQGESVRLAALLALSSTQYLAIAGLWIIMPIHSTKLIPFTLISLLHVIDTISPKLSDKFSDGISAGIGWSNLFIFFKLVLDVLRLRNGGMISFLAYSLFYRIRFEFSHIDRDCAKIVWNKVDQLLGSPKAPAKVHYAWTHFKRRVESRERAIVEKLRQEEEKAIKEENSKHRKL